jgi:hypothetical protein
MKNISIRNNKHNHLYQLELQYKLKVNTIFLTPFHNANKSGQNF